MSKKLITKKQQQILTLILAFRFINSKQLQKFLGHTDHRRINSWLKDLADKEYIVRDYHPVFGTLTKPAVCYLSLLGRRYLRDSLFFDDNKYLMTLRGDKKRSKAFRIKCQLIADFYLTLFEGKEKAFISSIQDYLHDGVILPSHAYQFFTPAFYHELDFVLLPYFKPDAYIYQHTKKGIIHTCIFALDAYIPRLMLHYLLKRLFQAFDEAHLEDDVASLHFYFVCPNNIVIIYLKRLLRSFLGRYYKSKPLLFYFATRNELSKKKEGNIEEVRWQVVSSRDY